MVALMEELCGSLTEWRDILLGKGLDVNAAKSIVIVGHKAVVGYTFSPLNLFGYWTLNKHFYYYSESVCGVCRKIMYAPLYVYRIYKVESHAV